MEKKAVVVCLEFPVEEVVNFYVHKKLVELGCTHAVQTGVLLVVSTDADVEELGSKFLNTSEEARELLEELGYTDVVELDTNEKVKKFVE